MVAPAQLEGRRWRGLALTTAAVLGLHLSLLDIRWTETVQMTTPGKVMITRHLSEAAKVPSQKAAVASEAPIVAREPEAVASKSPAAAESVFIAETVDSGAVSNSIQKAPPEADKDRQATPFDAASNIQLPGSITLRYSGTEKFNGSEQRVDSTLTWDQDGSVYTARLETSAGTRQARVQSSVGKLGPEGLLPERFADRRRTEQATHFLRESGLIRFSANAPDAPLSLGAQDRLSVIFQVAGLVAGNAQARRGGHRISVPTATSRTSDLWVFDVVGDATMEENADVHLRRSSNFAYDETLEIWLTPKFGFMPRRFRITYANGDFIDQELVLFRE